LTLNVATYGFAIDIDRKLACNKQKLTAANGDCLPVGLRRFNKSVGL